MRGTILGFDAASGTGAITDATGGRLKFGRDAWRSPGEPVPGRAVDFEVEGGEAVDIFLVPGGSGLGFGGDDPARSAMTAGIISLSCALISFVIHPLGILTLLVAVGFGIKGKNLGRDLPDRTAYYLSIAGLLIAGLQLLVILLALTACAGLVGLIGLSTIYWH
jgi:hypothetical protein